MKKLVFSLLLAASSLTLFATEFFVDDDNYGKSGMDGSTRELAFGTIQEGVDAANHTDDIVTVLPGVYDKGESFFLKSTNRVALSKCKITLRGTPGHRNDTIILGHRSISGTVGSDAVRCVYIDTKANGSIVQGFTFKNGTAWYNSSECYGGGLYGAGNDHWVVDCKFENCHAYRGGALYQGHVHRCLFVGNSATADGNASAGFRLGTVSQSVFLNNEGDAIFYYCKGTTFLNCSFYGNNYLFYTGCGNIELYNCAHFGNFELARDAGSGSFYVTNLVNFVTDRSDQTTLRKHDSWCQYGQDGYEFFAPIYDDFRLVEGSIASTTGDAQWLNKVTLPEGVENRDYAGNLLDPNASAFAVGAVQTTCAPASKALKLSKWHGVYHDADDNPLPDGYAFYEYWPTQIVLKPVVPDGKVWGLSAVGVSSIYRFPDMNGQVVLMPPPKWASGSQEYKIIKTTTVLKVDPAGTDGAYTTLQAAVDASSMSDNVYTLIEAAAGEYKTGGAVMRNLMSRVAISNRLVRLVGAGAGKSFIVGAPDPNDATCGIGPDAVRCVAFGASKNAAVQGFTLTGGHSDTGSAKGGAAAMGYDYSKNFLLDVEIHSITGGTYVCGEEVMIQRAKVHDVWANENSIFGIHAFASAVLGYNWHQVNTRSWGACLVNGEGEHWCNSTLVGERNQNLIRAYLNTALMIVHTSAETFLNRDSRRNEGVLFYNTDEPSKYDAPFEYLYGYDPEFVNPTAADYRLSTTSPALDAFDATVCCSNSWQFIVGDINGDPIRIINGKATPGCYQTDFVPVTKLTLTRPSAGGMIMEGATYGENRLVPGDTVKVAAILNRPFEGFQVDGTISDPTVTNLTFTATDSPASIAVEPIYGTTWHVDAVNGRDANSGAMLTDAKRSLKSLLESGFVIAADTILAEDGVYNEGEMASPTDGMTVGFRAVLNLNKLKLVSRNGPEKTVIMGKSGSGTDGLGPGALHCLYLREGATVSGFTITGGRTLAYASGAKWNYDNCYAAIVGFSGYASIVENCIVSNNVSPRYAAGNASCFVRCRIEDNRSDTRGPAGANSGYVSCYINNNSGACQFQTPVWFESSTVGPDVYPTDTFAYTKPENFHAVNTLFLCPRVCPATETGVKKVNNMSNCVFLAGSVVGENSNLVACVSVSSLQQLKFDAEGRPVVGWNAAVDAGDFALYNALNGDTDLSGAQRVTNGKLDVGCREADWRNRYARDLGIGVGVTAADPQVVEDRGPDGYRCVRIDSGTISAVWNKLNAATSAKVAVVGTGTLTVKCGASVLKTVTAEDGTVTVPVEAAAVPQTVDFIFTPGGDDAAAYAYVYTFGGEKATRLMFR